MPPSYRTKNNVILPATNLYITATGMEFDLQKARLGKLARSFKPFHTHITQRVEDLIEKQEINLQEDLFVMQIEEHPPLAFIVREIAYHHIAQGTLQGTPSNSIFHLTSMLNFIVFN